MKTVKPRPVAPARRLIIGNWKMNPESPRDAAKWMDSIARRMPKRHKAVVIVCPPTVFLAETVAKARAGIKIGAQSVSHYESGSHTGEVSARMAKKAGATYTIIGHSERRNQKEGVAETDSMVASKTLYALKEGLLPIVCVGEDRRDDHGLYLGLLKKQLLGSLEGVTKQQIKDVVIAYEPVYAIGAKQALDPHDIHQMTLYIKKALMDSFGPSHAQGVRVVYGGSVDPVSAAAILGDGEVDGLLIGRASWDPATFCQIIATA